MSNNRKLTDPKQLDWAVAREAAERILTVCDNAGFTAPEDLEVHRRHIVRVCEQINVLVEALCIIPPTRSA